ncbi:hypothetical protein PVK06_002306 [Gossypium arboreum]|uniref:Uncharacterized protein n=1 Tax=Gossypium arboreum TaxID=29729 RepID=A0ABR0R390_GOSAR|nr:hypothetical protein PVK06_002306 [Gossypium arboreum]
MDDGTNLLTAPTQSPGPLIVPTQLPDPTPQPTTPTTNPFRLCQAIIAGEIARGTVGELISLPFPIALWDSNTSAVGNTNTSTFFILLRWVILPTLITGATTTPVEANKNPTGSITTPAGATNEESST